MALTIEQQISSLLRGHHSILICLPAKPTTDAIASGLAMYGVLQKLGKQAKIVAAGFALPDNHRFLPKSDEISHELTALKKFVISVDVSKTTVQDVQYDIHDQRLNVYITPKNGYLETRDVTTSSSDYAFDLIVVLDSQDLASLGKVFEDNAEFFHHTPMINIDHHAANENFGEINLVKVTATSISEIIFELLEHLDSGELLDEYIATHLLTGIISKTKSFKTNAVTPRSLAIASHLIASGARREEIVRNLYQTKTLSALKLWGRALSQLQSDPDRKLVWSILHQTDFFETATTPLELPQVIDELIINTPDAQNVYIVYEVRNQTQNQIQAVIATAPYIQSAEVFRDFQPVGADNFTFLTIPVASVTAAQQLIHDRLRALVK